MWHALGVSFSSRHRGGPLAAKTHPLLAVLGDQRKQIGDAVLERLLLLAECAELAHALRDLVREGLFELVDVDWGLVSWAIL